ncbi:MAG: STT3 domain-containing protein [Candidatus Omnitrophica bacterium]|nr:STT3 domain-containing protein [Candidatus Omnitrophota bacterium]MDD5429970.1 STT3 domain-containing protein [Candidatus Omnitrophota bacterium]
MRKKIFPICFLFLAAGFNIYLLLFPAYFPQYKEQAVFNVDKKMFQEAYEFVEKTRPEFNPLVKEKIAKEVVTARKKNRKLFKEDTYKEYKKLKSKYQDDSGQTFLLEVDPYCRLRFTRLILENGYPGNKIEGGKVYDTFMLAPLGSQVPSYRFLYYLSAWLYRVPAIFIPALSLEAFVFYLPVFYAGLLFLILYLFCRHIFTKSSGILAVLFLGLSPAFISRSCAGWFDQDTLSLILPLLAVWSLAAGLKSSKYFKNIFLTILSALFLAVFAYTWIGWWFIYLTVIIFFIITILNKLILLHGRQTTIKDLSDYLLSFVVFLVFSEVFCFTVAGLEPISSTYAAIRENLGLGVSMTISIWPLVVYTVSELTPGDFRSIPVYTGGSFLFILAIAGFLWQYITRRKTKQADSLILLTLWMFFMVFASLKGLRFTFFLCLPLSVFLGLGLSEAAKKLWSFIEELRSASWKRVFRYLIVFFISLGVVFLTNRGIIQAQRQTPLMNDAWNDFLIKIKKQTPTNCIVNAWWDYGNWIKEVSRRRSVVDPQVQGGPITYWMARVFLAENEEEALRILRMINNSSDKLFMEIESALGDEFRAIACLNKILKSEAKSADAIMLEYGLSKALRIRIKETIFSRRPAPACILVNKKMTRYISNLSFLGNWDFSKVYIAKHIGLDKEIVIEGTKNTFGLNTSRVELLYEEALLAYSGKEKSEELSRRWQFSGTVGTGSQQEEAVYFDNGVIFYPDSGKARIYLGQQKQYRMFKYVLFFDGGRLMYKKNEASEDTLKTGCLIVRNKLGWKSVGLTNEGLGKSLFSRLYFAKGEGLKYFKPLVADDKNSLYAFMIDWPDAN